MATPKNPFKSKPFLDLKNEWYTHLEHNGFKDIEQNYEDPQKAMLKRWDSLHFTTKSHVCNNRDVFILKHDYYYYAAQFLIGGEFGTDLDRDIWELHAQGLGVRAIADTLNDSHSATKKYNRQSIWMRLRPLQLKMKEYLKEVSDMQKKDIVDLRLGKKEDEPYIYSTWLQNLYANTRWRTSLDRKAFFKYHSVIEVILNKPTTTIRVACLKEDPDIILGYSVFEDTTTDMILHWVFVRADWQGHGIARDLVPLHVTVVTHMTKIGERIWSNCSSKPRQILLPLSYEILETAPQFKENRSQKNDEQLSPVP